MTKSRPLEGLTVFEVGHSIAAPYAGLILADLGARVIKVENPQGGDYARGWGPPFWGDSSSVFHSYNRGKESISVNLSDPEACAGLRARILAEGDAVVQNLRPGALARYGLDPETLGREKPSLIWCDIGAFGPGPLSDKPGYDPLMQAFAGIMSVTGEGERPPVRVGVSLVDMGAGMWAVIGLLASLVARSQSGGYGGNVSTSLYETGLSWMMVHLAGYAASGDIRKPYGSGLAEIVPYQAFATTDGWLMVAAGNDNLFTKLCQAIGRKDLASTPDFKTNAGRVAERDRLLSEITQTLRDFGTAELAAALDDAGVPNAPIQSVDEVMEHPHTRALGMIEPVEGDQLPLVGLPLSFDGSRPRTRGPAPSLGQHNAGETF